MKGQTITATEEFSLASIRVFNLQHSWALKENGRKGYVRANASGLWMRMERVLPACPTCGKQMTYYSSDVFSEHYMCPSCDQFLAVERRAGFFTKSPFKPRYPLIHD